MRNFMSMPALLGAAMSALALVGCYDLSDPTGPRRSDFVREPSATETQEQRQAQAATDEPCTQGSCVDALTGAGRVDDFALVGDGVQDDGNPMRDLRALPDAD